MGSFRKRREDRRRRKYENRSYVLPDLEITPLRRKQQYQPWALQLKEKLSALSIVELTPGHLSIKQPLLRSLSGREFSIALGTVLGHISPRLADFGWYDGNQNVERLWFEIYKWAISSSSNFWSVCDTCAISREYTSKWTPLKEFKRGIKQDCYSCQTIIDSLEAFSPGMAGNVVGKDLAICDNHPLVFKVRDQLSTTWTTSFLMLEIHDAGKEQFFFFFCENS